MLREYGNLSSPSSSSCCARRSMRARPAAGGGCRPSARASAATARCLERARRWQRTRVVEPEWLDELPHEDPRAQRSRRDLVRVNALMGNARIVASELARLPALRSIAEIGAGDGAFMRAVLRAAVVAPEVHLVDRQPLGTITADVFDWLSDPGVPRSMRSSRTSSCITSTRPPARMLVSRARERAAFIACEPRRSPLRSGSPASRPRRLQRRDAPRCGGERARGFAGRELTALWPAAGGWTLEERARGPFSHASWPAAMAEPLRRAHRRRGPAGSSAAILLASRGMACRGPREGAFPRRKVCGEYISGAAWPLLDELGRRCARLAAPGPKCAASASSPTTCVIDAPMPAGARPGRALGREHLDTLLVERARECGAKCARATPVGGRRGAARVVIGAHGAWEAGELPTQPRAAAARAQISSVQGALSATRGCRETSCRLSSFPGVWRHGDDGRRSREPFLLRAPRCAARRARVAARVRAGDALLRTSSPANRGVRERSTARASRTRGFRPADSPAIRRFRAGGVFAIGNAAGEAHPIVAEGISMAIQSSFLLCERLVRAGRDAPRAPSTRGARVRERVARNFARACARRPPLRGARHARSGPHRAARFVAMLPAILTVGAHWSGKDRALRRGARRRGRLMDTLEKLQELLHRDFDIPSRSSRARRASRTWRSIRCA
jgi:flavin-dependent dehydrogenase